METVVKVVMQYGMTTREYQNERGMQTINSVELLLSTGLDQFFAEAVGPLAVQLDKEPASSSNLYNASFSMYARSGKSKDGRDYHITDLRLNKLLKL